MFDCIIQPIFKDVTYMLMKAGSQEAIGIEEEFNEVLVLHHMKRLTQPFYCHSVTYLWVKKNI